MEKLNQIKPNKTWDIFTEENGGNGGFVTDELVCRRELPVACERWLQAKAASTLSLCRRSPNLSRVGGGFTLTGARLGIRHLKFEKRPMKTKKLSQIKPDKTRHSRGMTKS